MNAIPCRIKLLTRSLLSSFSLFVQHLQSMSEKTSPAVMVAHTTEADGRKTTTRLRADTTAKNGQSIDPGIKTRFE